MFVPIVEECYRLLVPALAGNTFEPANWTIAQIGYRSPRIVAALEALLENAARPKRLAIIGTLVSLGAVGEESKRSNRLAPELAHRGQAPLRVLTTRAHGALQALKPCMMLSPLTVAQFLDPKLPPFDVVVMDEASQILPEDALGAIARGKQLIVVGDPKQLPPTGFFKIASDDDANEDDETLVEGAESILEVCEAAFGRMRRLKWHYRSLHESLIAFSNVEFYDNELLVFPSPVRDASKYGVRFHKVDGLYQNNRNEIEARAVIEAVIAQLRTEPNKSIGVITFNLKQKELLEDLLAAETQKDPLLAELIDAAETGQEPLIIRNLESIQGEQRDIIFISVNYGPETPGGRMAQRFGPVNSRNGWRRLNVMFSRAKERMEVFASVYADSIVAEPGATTGAAYLSRFLKYAQTGIL